MIRYIFKMKYRILLAIILATLFVAWPKPVINKPYVVDHNQFVNTR